MKRIAAKTRGDIVAALDIGTSKTCCYIARITDSDQTGGESGGPGMQVLGIGYQVAKGMRNGVVIDMDAAEHAVRRSVHAAEKMAAVTVARVFVNLSCGLPQSNSFEVGSPIAGQEVGEPELRRIIANGRAAPLPEERELIHAIPVDFSIDGARGIRDPRGMAGRRLGAQFHLVSALSGPVRNLSMLIQRCHLNVESYVVTPYASGLGCLVEDEIDLGATVIDMGGGTTTVAVFFDGSFVFTDVIPIGGMHVTNDIARGLSTPIADAERLKTLHGSATFSPLDDRETVDVPQVGENASGTHSRIQRSMLVRIIQPRLEEIFEQVGLRLRESGFDAIAGRRIVVTGGASQMPSLRELAETVLGKQVRLGRPVRLNGLPDVTSGPAFATCAGLLSFAVKPGFDTRIRRPGSDGAPGPKGALGRACRWLRENF